MATITDPPHTPSPLVRAELGDNKQEFLQKDGAFRKWMYDFYLWIRVFTPWVKEQKDDMQSYYSATQDAKAKAEMANSQAQKAWSNINGYTIPNGTAWSTSESDKVFDKLLGTIMKIEVTQQLLIKGAI